LKYSSDLVDVKESDWFSKYVEYSLKNNLIDNPTNKFSPNNNLKRIEAISILYTLSKH
jgi:hypothetical protein